LKLALLEQLAGPPKRWQKQNQGCEASSHEVIDDLASPPEATPFK